MLRIALFRGINVGGRNLLPMRSLVTTLEGLGAGSVTTYIQSGNAVFRHPQRSASRLAASIRGAVLEAHGIDTPVLVISARDLEAALTANPYPEGDPARVVLTFLEKKPPRPDLARLESLRAPTERFTLEGRTFYLSAPDGLARSRLATEAEKALGVNGTSRNLRTATRLVSLARSLT